MTTKIYTKTGDRGDTGLFGGGRVSKDHPRVEAYGAVDELNASLGLARSIEMMPRIDEVVVPVQRDLFGLGALLATPDADRMRQQLEKARIDDTRIAELERAIDEGKGRRAVAHTVNDEPQPQVVFAFGLRITNCAPVSDSV